MHEVSEIISFLEKELGLLFNEDRKERVSALVAGRMRATGRRSPGLYLDLIRSAEGSEELNRLIGRLTVGETHFFRNQQHWQAFREYVLPGLTAGAGGNQGFLKLWSAGCSTGEEPYTIAMCLCEVLAPWALSNIRIMASDINEESIEKAKKGLYTENSFREVDKYFIGKYFFKRKERYQLAKEVRRLVEFDKMNLVSPMDFTAKYSDFDVIFCRNVLMYFRPDVSADVVQRLHPRLKKKGFLFLGHAEGMLADNDLFEHITRLDTFFFQKKEAVSRRRSGKGGGVPRFQWPTVVKSKPALEKRPAPTVEPALTTDGVEFQNNVYTVALRLYSQDDFGAALEALSGPETRRPKGLKELILMALSYLKISDLARAWSCYEQAFKLSDVSSEVYLLEAMIKEARGDFEGAASANQAAIYLDKDFFCPHFRLGYIHEARGDAQKARRHFTAALKALETDDEKRVMLFCGRGSKRSLKEICEQKAGL